MKSASKTILFFQTGSPILARRKLAGVSAIARERGWRVVSAEKFDAPFDVRAEIKAVGATGVIAECSGPHAEFTPSALHGIAHVYLCRDPEEIGSALACVSNDSPAIGALAARTLLPHAVSTVFVGWYKSVYWSDRKRDAFVETCRAAGKRTAVFEGRASDQRHRAAFITRLAEAIAGLPRPIGLFAVCDEIGALAEDAARAAGLGIGKEISILAANDDESLCESCTPPLASVHLDYEATGRLAGTILLDALEGKRSGERLFAVPPLQVRARPSLIRTTASDDEVDAALEFIRREATSGLSPADVAARFSCSRRPAEIRFKARTGQTFSEAIVDARLAAAERLLSLGTVSMSAVASRCGWRSETLFRRQFKARTGQTPLAWSKRRSSHNSRGSATSV